MLIWETFSRHLATQQLLSCTDVHFGCISVCFFPSSLSEQVKLQPCSAVTPKLSSGGCRHGPCKECWTLIIFAPGMNLQ